MKAFWTIIIIVIIAALAVGAYFLLVPTRTFEVDFEDDEIGTVETPTENNSDVVETGITFESESEIEIDTSEMVAQNFDGPVIFSLDGKYVAIQMSNMTMGSSQVQIIDTDSGERKAIVSGYDLRWDETDPQKINFTQHEYLDAPDYGTQERILSVNEADLFAAGVFNEEDVPFEEIGIADLGSSSSSAECSEVLSDESIFCAQEIYDGEYVIFTREGDDGRAAMYVMPKDGDIEKAEVLVGNQDENVEYFDTYEDTIIYPVLSIESGDPIDIFPDESNTKFIISKIKK